MEAERRRKEEKERGLKVLFGRSCAFSPVRAVAWETRPRWEESAGEEAAGEEAAVAGGRACRLEQSRPYMEIFTFWLPRPSAAATPPRRERGLLFYMNQLLSCLKGSRERKKEQAAVGLSETESSTAVGPSRPPAPLRPSHSPSHPGSEAGRRGLRETEPHKQG